jgi:Flp pilus assembly CpaE family ATPase
MDTTTTQTTEMGTVKAVGAAITAADTERLAVSVADAKAELNAAKDIFAAVEKKWLATGTNEYRTEDGRTLTVVHSQIRELDTTMIKDIVGRGVWQRITVPTIDTKAFDVECDGGRIDADEIAAAVTFKDRKPSVRVK